MGRHSAARRAFPDNLTIHFEAPAFRAESPPHAPFLGLFFEPTNKQITALFDDSMLPKVIAEQRDHCYLPTLGYQKQQSYNFLLLILCYLTIATILYIFNSLFVLGSSSVKYTN